MCSNISAREARLVPITLVGVYDIRFATKVKVKI